MSGGRASSTFIRRAVDGLVLLLCCVLFFSAFSVLRPLSETYPGVDSSVFQYVGRAMLEGQVPYRDLFDHKGPLLYLINALGWLVHGESGVWLIEIVSLWCSALLWRSTAIALGLSRRGGTVVALAGICVFAGYFDGGNLAEEYCLPLVSGLVMVATVAITSGRATTAQSLLAGALCGGVFLLKFNALAFALPLIVGAIVRCRGTTSGRAGMAGLGLLGFLLPVVPFAAWLGAEGALAPFVRDYLLFNASYAGGAEFPERISSMLYFLGAADVLVAFAALLAGSLRGGATDGKRFLCRVSLAGFALGFLVVAGAGREYPHYGMHFVPFVVLGLAMTPVLLRRLGAAERSVALAVIGVACAYVFAVPNLTLASRSYLGSASSYEGLRGVVDLVLEETAAEDTISVVGNACWVYNKTGRWAPSVVFYVPGVSDAEPWAQRMKADALSSDTGLVLVSDQFDPLFSSDDAFLDRYEQGCTMGGLTVYSLKSESSAVS